MKSSNEWWRDFVAPIQARWMDKHPWIVVMLALIGIMSFLYGLWEGWTQY